MEFQIAESQSLISSRRKDLAKIMATLPSLQSEIEELNQHYNYLTESAITERDAEGLAEEDERPHAPAQS